MARFHDLIADYLSAEEGDRSPSIYDDLTAEYDNLYSGGIASGEAHAAELAALQSQIDALKSQNYDLLMATGRSDESAEEKTDESEDDDSDAIDELFTKKDD